MITKYDRLIGDSSDYVVLPIVYKAGWSYKWSMKYLSELTATDTTGTFASGGISIFHSTYREMRIDGFSSTIWSGFSGIETLEITPSGVLKNGTSISTLTLNEDATANIKLFSGNSYEYTMGNFVHLRSLEVWDSEGTLIHKYVPCKFGNSVGLFDDVLHSFVPSANNTLSVENDA